MRKESFIVKHYNLLLRNFVMTLLIIFVLLMIVSRFVYMSFNRLHIDNVKNEKRKEMYVVAERFSQNLNDLDTIAYSILTNNKTAPHNIDRGGYSGIVATRELLNHEVGNSFIEGILLYTKYNNRNMLTSSSSICDINVALLHKYGYPESAKADIDDIIFNNYRPVLLSTEYFMKELQHEYLNPKYKKRFLYIFPPAAQYWYTNSTVMFLIKEQTLQGFAEQAMSGYKGYFYLFDKESNLVYSFHVNETPMDSEVFLSNLDLTSSETDGLDLEIAGISYTVFHEQLTDHPYSLMLIIPTSQYLMPMEEWMNSFTMILLALLASGIFIAVLITIANYVPIYKFTSALKQITNLGHTPAIGKELPYISTALVSLSNQNINLQRENEVYSTARRREFLTNLFKDNYLKTDIHYQADLVGISVIDTFFVVMCIGLNNYNDFLQQHSKDMQLLLKEAIITQCEKSLSGLGNVHGVEVGEGDVYAVLFNAYNNSIKTDELNNVAQKLVTYFEENFEISITIGMSSGYCSIEDTPNAYNQARTALDYRLVYSKSRIILYDNIMRNSSGSNWYPVLLEQKLLEAIKTLDTKKISDILNQLMLSFHEKNLTIKEVQFICCSLIGTLISFMSHMHIDADSDFHDVQSLFIDFRFQTLDEVQQNLDRLIMILCKYISNQQSQKENSLINEIIEYIYENYGDNTLCLQSIAKHFNYSVSYISRIFKEHTGYTLINYVDNVRMQKTKQLLREADYSISQILTLVGYNDKNNFIRKFRRSEGITPMEYRKNYQSRLMYILND